MLSLYQCHKQVQACKILGVFVDQHALVLGHEGAFQEIVPGPNYFNKHDPQPGGYYVVYADGYESYSPAEAFETGYTRVE